MRSGSDYWPTNICARSYDTNHRLWRLRHQLPTNSGLKEIRAIIKIRATHIYAVCFIHVSIRYYQINQ